MSEKWNLHIVSHSHWDREWYMSCQQYRYRYVKLMDRLLDILAESGEYKSFMMDGQVLILGDYLDLRPEKRDALSGLTAGGRLLPGPWYSQPNEFMVSGEALIRNLMLGRRECLSLGAVMNVCYLPDAFGHISQLPGIMSGFGMEDAVLWRGLPAGAKTAFRWRGADGAECLVHYLYPGYSAAKDLPSELNDYVEVVDETQLQRAGLRNRIESLLEKLAPKAVSRHLLLLNGADHTFAQSNLPEVIAAINENIPGVNAFHDDLPGYIAALRSDICERCPELQLFEGELRDCTETRILPASQSTHTGVKIANNRAEAMLEKWVEPFSAYVWMLGGSYPAAGIWKAWEYVLQNQSHDSLACSSVDSTYHDVMRRYAWADELGREIMDESLQKICSSIRPDGEKTAVLAVFNPLNWRRSETVEVDADVPAGLNIEYPALMDDKMEVSAVVLGRKETLALRFNPRSGHPDAIPVHRYKMLLSVKDVPANGFKALKLVERGSPPDRSGSLVTGRNRMENGFVCVTINGDGTFDVYDRTTKRRYESLNYFEDAGEAGNGFQHIAPVKDLKVLSIGAGADISVVEDTPFRATFRVEFSMNLPVGLTGDSMSRSDETAECRITSRISLCDMSPRIDILTEICNPAGDHRLRAVFPAGIDAGTACVEQPFDVVERKIALPDPAAFPGEKPSRVHPQLSFVDVSGGGAGLMVANRGLYEYEVMDSEERSIALTLLRCTDRLYGGIYGERDAIRLEEAQRKGRHSFQYSVIPHEGTWRNAFREAFNFRFPMLGVLGRSLEEERLPGCENEMEPTGSSLSFIESWPDSLVLSAVKRHESRESLVVRMFNSTSENVQGRLGVNCPGCSIESAYRTDMKEERLEELETDGGRVLFDLHGKGIITVELMLAGAAGRRSGRSRK